MKREEGHESVGELKFDAEIGVDAGTARTLVVES